MSSKIEIVNISMTLIGEDTIVSLTGDLGERERKVNALFDITRDEVLSAFPWGFAKKQQALALNSIAPVFTDEFAYAYAVPSDCLRILSAQGQTTFKRVGDKVFSNESPLLVEYIRRITDTAKWDGVFINAFSAKLAMKLAYSLTDSTSLTEMLRGYYRDAIQEARAVSSQEGVEETLYRDVLSEARYGG